MRGVRALSGVLGHPPAQKCPEQAHIRLLRRVGGKGSCGGPGGAPLARAPGCLVGVSPKPEREVLRGQLVDGGESGLRLYWSLFEAVSVSSSSSST